LIKDLIKEEVEAINSKLDENGYEGPRVQDPSGTIQLIMNRFNEWYSLLRQPFQTADTLLEIAEKTVELQWLFMEIFPEKSGKCCACVVCAQLVYNPCTYMYKQGNVWPGSSSSSTRFGTLFITSFCLAGGRTALAKLGSAATSST